MWCDNTQTIRLVNEEVDKLTTTPRHVDIHNHWLRELREQGKLVVKWLPTDQMVADVLTKAKPAQEHHKAVKLLKLKTSPDHSGGKEPEFTQVTI